MQRPAWFEKLNIHIAAHPDEGRPVHGNAVGRYFVIVLELKDDDAVRHAVADIDDAGERGQRRDLAARQLHRRAGGMEIHEVQRNAARVRDELDRPEGIDIEKLRDRKRG